jgi:hypothetical protein
MKYCLICLTALSMLASGCTTNYYAKAVKNAREYAMEKYPDLDEEALHWIRFTSPQIQQDIINHPTNEYSHSEFAQTSMIWNIPEYDGKSLVVVGFSDKRMKDWYPIRAMFKRYRYIDSPSGEEKGKKSSKKSKSKSLTFNLDRDSKKK